MVKYEDECVRCGLTCLGKDCPFSAAEHHYCDYCGEETKLYDYNGDEVCQECLVEALGYDVVWEG